MIILICSWLRRVGNASQGVSIYFFILYTAKGKCFIDFKGFTLHYSDAEIKSWVALCSKIILNKDFTNTIRGGVSILWKFFIKFRFFLNDGFPKKHKHIKAWFANLQSCCCRNVLLLSWSRGNYFVLLNIFPLELTWYDTRCTFHRRE